MGFSVSLGVVADERFPVAEGSLSLSLKPCFSLLVFFSLGILRILFLFFLVLKRKGFLLLQEKRSPNFVVPVEVTSTSATVFPNRKGIKKKKQRNLICEFKNDLSSFLISNDLSSLESFSSVHLNTNCDSICKSD